MTPLQQRIVDAYKQTRQYHDMLRIVFPNPLAHRCASHGGPPSCARNFSVALRKLGGYSHGMGSQRTVYIPGHVGASLILPAMVRIVGRGPEGQVGL